MKKASENIAANANEALKADNASVSSSQKSQENVAATKNAGLPEIVFATNNEHKLQEVRELTAGKMRILSLNDIDCHDDIPETADTLEGNALMKAQWVHDRYGHDCFSDDTGLEIDALGGAPGVHSARYGGVAHDSERNIDRVLGELQGVTDRTARFRTIIALMAHGEVHTFAGKVEGHIATERHGTGGFGYDAIFIPDEGDGRSFAQMAPEEKNAISHRGRATALLVEFLINNYL